jgi:hypothetical protein
MPFESKAQQRFAHANPEKFGGAKGLKEWDDATDFKHLPEKKFMSKHERPKHTHIEHHKDGSHTKKHMDADMKEMSSSAHGNDADMMASMQQALSGPQEAPPAEAGAAPAAPAPPAA